MRSRIREDTCSGTSFVSFTGTPIKKTDANMRAVCDELPMTGAHYFVTFRPRCWRHWTPSDQDPPFCDGSLR